ncbi:hypothetical protein RZS28_01680 [Methylocapsa polymorpha]|uniref:Uncharacterized protein n=1 Tax=Methylocapsa polymorpha TaxID=3080828 RepID=A0ABZ0HUG5_9HYPH|nr:hypothetical protein RZS28_01680 [Methylocapsa sp. RX1]
MRIQAKLGLVAGAILASTLGFASLGQAAPATGLAAGQAARDAIGVEARPETAHYGHVHRHYHSHHRYYHHHYHR